MQDNRLQKEKDPAFEDKAWMDMRELLDKEMPVQKKERSLLWWWGSAGILMLLIILGSLFVFLNKNQADTIKETNRIATNNSSINTKKDIQVVESNKDKLDKDTQIKTFDKNAIPTKQEVKPLKTIEHNPNKKSLIELNNKVTKGTAHSTALENRIYPNIIDDDALNLQNAIINPRKALEEITPSSLGSPTFNQEEKVALVTKKEQLVIQTIPSLELLSLQTEFYKPTFPVHAIPKKSRVDWALVASLGTFKLTRLNEYAVGLKTTYQWHPKWRVGTGLNYHYFRFNGLVKVDNNVSTFSEPEPEVDKSMDSMDATAGAPAGTAGGGNLPEEEDLGDLATTEIEQSFVDPLTVIGNGHYLSMPLLLEYKASSKIKLDVGAAYYYKLTTSYDSADNRIRPNDWTTFIGVGYELTPYFDLRFSYERNWSNQRSNSVNTDLLNANSLNDLLSAAAVVSPLEGRLRLSGIWRF